MPDKTNTSASYWKKTIMGINDRRILEYIQDQVRIRLDHARADHNLTKPEPKKGKDGSVPYSSSYDTTPRKLKPLSMDKLLDAGKDKDEPVY